MRMAILLKIHTINILSPSLEKEKGLFLKRVGELLEEGYSIKHTLEFIDKFEQKTVRGWIASIQTGLLQGSLFHEELAKIGFSSKTCSQIYLASQYGSYGQVIKRCGAQLLEQETMKKKLQSLLSYPIILLVFLVGMLMMMRFLILPNMATMFSTQSEEATIYSNPLVLFIHYSPQILIFIILCILLGFVYLKKILEKRSEIEKITFFMSWPILNQYLKDYWTHFLFFEWGQLLKNGTSFQELVSIMSGKDASLILQETGQKLTVEMSKGKTVKEAIECLPFFRDEAMLVISHGENLGQLSTEMLVYSSYCEAELMSRIEKMLGTIQPFIFIFIGFMIVAIYASMMLPIFSLMEGFK